MPIAAYNTTLDGANIRCALAGSSAHFTREALQVRYGSADTYVAAYSSRAQSAVDARIMTPADREAAVAAAGSVSIP